ncbi:MAG: EcsC family protein [Selenomonas ruminantium]|uniref:EcsC family protein n=1 Tax=Selenomonas ruminantium TaxID=971 RepID=A0A927ZS59_SELRU|nr:EcsC family protein [Selenomonas ruminantium]
MVKALDSIYSNVIDGLPGAETAEELAKEYLRESGTLSEKADSLIRWQIAKCSTSGFLTGIGGFITLPVAIPANLASVIYVQLRMIAAIAYMGGYNPRDDKVKTLAYVCLCGNQASEIIKDSLAIPLAKVMATAAIKQIPTQVLKNINKRVGVRLVTKFGEKGIINLGKAIPLFGGIIGGTIDGVTTNTIGETAKKCFINK